MAELRPSSHPSTTKTIVVKFTIEAVHAALDMISTIQGRLEKGVLWSLRLVLITGIHKFKHTNHPIEGYGQYLRTNVDQGIIYNICFRPPQ